MYFYKECKLRMMLNIISSARQKRTKENVFQKLLPVCQKLYIYIYTRAAKLQCNLLLIQEQYIVMRST